MPKIIATLLCLLFLINPAFAETILVKSGTRIEISLPNTITSESLEGLDTLQAQVNRDIFIDGKKVFIKNAPVELNIERIRKRGILGKSGKIELNGGFVTDAFNQRHPISFSHKTKGKSRRAFSIAYSILSIPLIVFWVGLITLPIAISIKGKPASMQGGMIFEVFTTANKTTE